MVLKTVFWSRALRPSPGMSRVFRKQCLLLIKATKRHFQIPPALLCSMFSGSHEYSECVRLDEARSPEAASSIWNPSPKQTEVSGDGQRQQWTFCDFYPSGKGRNPSVAIGVWCVASLTLRMQYRNHSRRAEGSHPPPPPGHWLF
jgi:hypothetical protein